MPLIFILTLLGGIGLLTLSVWPGMIEDTVFGFPYFLLSLPLLGFWFLLLVGLAIWDLRRKPQPPARRRRWGLWSAMVMFATIGLLWLHVPQRIVFAFCFSELRELANASATEEMNGEEFGRLIGPYWVDRYRKDRRGGVYFRTHIGPDGLGPDQMSFGFVLQPNNEGTPFGNASYRRRHLFGEWYVFAASNDW